MDTASGDYPTVEQLADLLRMESELATDLREVTTRALLDRLPRLAPAELRSVATLVDQLLHTKGDEPITIGELRSVAALVGHFLDPASRAA